MAKKILALVLVLALCLACFVGCTPKTEGGNTDGGKTTLNLYAFTDEVPKMVDKFLELNPEFAAKYDVVSTIIATTDGLYQPALDAALAAGGADAPDFYCAESAFVLKYTQGDAAGYAAPYADLGIDIDKAISDAQIAQYSVDIGTRPSDGAVVGLAYQATGGAFIYNRTAAKQAFGSDDPADVEAAIGAGTGNWDKFFEAAQTCADAGVAIVSGDGDIWHAIENSSDTPWVIDGKLNIDPKREAFLDYSKKLTDGGYSNVTQDWQEGWYADMAATGAKPVLGFYGPAWLINYVMAGNSGGTKVGEGTYGDWGVCASNVGFLWGGTWILANKDSANKEAVGQIINWITLDTSDTGLQYFWANGTLNGEGGTKDTVASNVVMAKSNGELDFLGGQNMFDAFMKGNELANGRVLTQYDESINNIFRDYVRQYAAGEIDRDTALASFKQNVADTLGLAVD